MNKYANLIFVFFFAALLLISCGRSKNTNIAKKTTNENADPLETRIKLTYEKSKIDTAALSYEAFKTAFKVYLKQKEAKKTSKSVLTVIDFGKPSTTKRMAIVDLKKSKLILQTYVAHGKNSGENFANQFSNINGSLQSSLGLYAVTTSYTGKYGKTLLLEGLEKGRNDLARMREIVMHPADYVSEKFIKAHGRLGRSWGCPAFPEEYQNLIVKTLEGNSCLYIWHPSLLEDSTN